MGKFRLIETIKLDSFGDEWKGAYLKFNGFNVSDYQEKLKPLADLDVDSGDSVMKNLELLIKLLADNFLEGRAVGGDGKLIDVKEEDIRELPMRILNHVIGFLAETSPQDK